MMDARVAYNGERISCGAFRGSASIIPESRKSYNRAKGNFFVSDEEYARIASLPVVRYESLPDINDGDKYEWYQFGNDKYGRTMYCVRTGIRRSQTMGEFYETSTVD